jgi:hypothetical protein
MEALQKVLLGLPTSEALNSWPVFMSVDQDSTSALLEAVSLLPDSSPDVLRLIQQSPLSVGCVELVAKKLMEFNLLVETI